MLMRTLYAAALAAAVSLPALAPAPAAAQDQATAASTTASRDGVTLPREVTVAGRTLVLNGLGLRKKFVVKVYVAGLYLPERSSDAEAILAADEPRHMVLEFLRGVSNDQMCGAFYDGLEDNTPDHSEALKAQFDEACAMMPEKIEKGDQLVFTYVPGTGTTIAVKGEARGTIPGKEFADALFRAWLGPKPGPGEGTKKDLLGARL
jgi:hypothetical protein